MGYVVKEEDETHRAEFARRTSAKMYTTESLPTQHGSKVRQTFGN